MSKTISIPTHNNPFTVIINNREYTYRGGETIEVPDEVAEAIEDALELVPKPKRYLSKFAQLVSGTLTEITAKDWGEITSIANHTFYKNHGLKRIEIPNTITSIGDAAMYSCSSLEIVMFGEHSKIESVGVIAFEKCSNLKRVYLPQTPPTLASTNAFNEINASCTFYCPSQASLDAYKAAPIWSTLTGTYAFVVEE